MIIKRQAGMTGIGWLTILALVGFFVALGLTILPIQIESYKVRKALERLNQVPHITKQSKKEITKLLMNQFSIEDVNSVKPENITYNKEKGILTIGVKYENRKTFIKPYDIVGVFDEELKVIER